MLCEQLIRCNAKIEPIEYAFVEDEEKPFHEMIMDLVVIVTANIGHDTDDAALWNKYARACVKKGGINATRSFVRGYQLGAHGGETTQPFECTCWGLRAPDDEEVLLSIVPKPIKQDYESSKKEIQCMLRMLNQRRGYIAWLNNADCLEGIHVEEIVNKDAPILVVDDAGLFIPSEVKRRLHMKEDENNHKKTKFVTPQKTSGPSNPNFVPHPRNPYTQRRKDST
jgi:hypothetical protein